MSADTLSLLLLLVDATPMHVDRVLWRQARDTLPDASREVQTEEYRRLQEVAGNRHTFTLRGAERAVQYGERI